MENNGSNLKSVEYLAMEEAQAQEVKIKPGPGSSSSGKPWTLNGCGKQRTSLEKLLLILLILVTLLCILIMVVVLLNRGDATQETFCKGESPASGNCTEVCMTSECMQLAGIMLSNMNPSVNPCDDFYDFSCGGWEERHTIPEDRSRLNVIELLQDRLYNICRDLLEQPPDEEATAYNKAKHFYAACMDEEKIDERDLDPLRTMISMFGGWPVANDGSFNEGSWDLVDALGFIRKTIGQHGLFFTDTKFEDIVEKKFYRLRIDQQQLGLFHRQFYLPETMNLEIVTAYRVYMSRLAAEMRPDHDLEEAMRQMNETFEFETELAKIQASDEERSNLFSMINQMTIANLSDITPQIDWLRYFREILNNEDIANSTIVFNFSPNYFEKVGKLLEKTPKRVIANYLMVRIMMNAADYLTTRIRQISRDFLRIKGGAMTDKPRWEICTEQVNEELPQAVGALFVKHYFSGESKHTAYEMYKNIRQALTETLDNTHWMDEDTQKKALEKIKYTDELIGYESNILNPEELNKIYADVEISPDTYFENVIRIETYNVKEESAMYGTPVNSSAKWIKRSPVSVNAWYSVTENAIFLPAGILQPPFYSRHFPKSLNYGGIGMVLGHELTHGFDMNGRHFGKDGRLEEWWSESSSTAYNERAQCLVDQYSSYHIPEIDTNVDGARTQSENIADNGGLKAAYLGYKKWVKEHGEETIRLPGLNYTSEQLFFINFGQIWCSMQRPADLEGLMVLKYPPSKFRVIGTISNIKAFAKAFNCPNPSAMNPPNKCELW